MLLIDGAVMFSLRPTRVVGCDESSFMIRAVVDQPRAPLAKVAEVWAVLSNIFSERTECNEATPTLLVLHSQDGLVGVVAGG